MSWRLWTKFIISMRRYGSEKSFPEMYGWDTFFVNMALMIHERFDLVRNHLLNQIYMIENYKMVLNGNRTFFLTRVQPPFHPETLRRLARHTFVQDIIEKGYPAFKKEYREYWTADHHSTPIGLATNHDLGNPYLRPELGAEAETGYDFCAMFDGDARQCVPIITNCVLVKYTQSLAWMAQQLGYYDESQYWEDETEHRKSLIRQYCWNEEEGFFFEYNYARREQIKIWSICAFWTIWADVATKEQAEHIVSHLARFECDGGLTVTDENYPSIHPEFTFLQWGYPTGWPPMQMMVVETLAKCGYHNDAERIAEKYLSLVKDQFERTGKLWEKYNVVKCNLDIPCERYEIQPMHGWSSAAVVYLMHYLDSCRKK